MEVQVLYGPPYFYLVYMTPTAKQKQKDLKSLLCASFITGDGTARSGRLPCKQKIQTGSVPVSSTNEDFKYQICDSLIEKNTYLRGAGRYRNIKFELNFSHSKV